MVDFWESISGDLKPIDASKSVDFSPSDVFMRLWRWRTMKDATATLEDFNLCAAAWCEIRRLEAQIDNLAQAFDLDDVPEIPEPPAPPIDDEETRKKVLEENSKRGKESFRQRKLADLEALQRAREAGVTMQTLADESRLTLNEVLDLLNGVAHPIATWAKLEKGLRKLGFGPERKRDSENGEEKQE